MLMLRQLSIYKEFLDPRYIKLKRGLEQLSNVQLQIIIDTPCSNMVFDNYNYDESTGNY
jgi:hypothetical protein